jgi:hypothetical protein
MVIRDADDQWEMVNNNDGGSGGKDQENDSDKASFNSDFKGGEMDVQEQIDRYVIENQDESDKNQVYRIKVIEEGADEMN